MKWAHSIQHKTKAAIVLAVVFTFFLGKILLEQRHVDELAERMHTLIEDRLLAESYLFELSEHVHGKKLLYDELSCGSANDDMRASLLAHSERIGAVTRTYAGTRLTEEEYARFGELRLHLAELRAAEERFLSSGVYTQDDQAAVDAAVASIVKDLHILSRIQVEVGKELQASSNKIVAGSSVLDHFEIALVVVAGLLLQVLIWASRSVLPRIAANPELN